jgi:hypothetical protein
MTDDRQEMLRRDKWRRYMGNVAPEVAARWERDQLRHALELRFGDSSDWDAEDLEGLTDDLLELLAELVGEDDREDRSR